MNPNKTFKRYYVITLLVLIALAVLAFHPMTSTWPQLSKLSAVNLQQIVILLSLGGLPGVLVWSSRSVKSLKNESDDAKRLARYTKIVYIRLAVFATLAVLILTLQAFTHMNAVLMMFMLVMVLFLFIWPTQARFDSEITPAQPVSDEESESSDDESDFDGESAPENGEDEEEDGWLPK